MGYNYGSILISIIIVKYVTMLGNKLKKAPNEDLTNQLRISLIYADGDSHEVGRGFL